MSGKHSLDDAQPRPNGASVEGYPPRGPSHTNVSTIGHQRDQRLYPASKKNNCELFIISSLSYIPFPIGVIILFCMPVKILLRPDSHDALLSHVPEGLPARRALESALLIRSYLNRSPREYDLECDEAVARSLLQFAAQYCPDAVKEIEFAIRLAGSNPNQSRRFVPR